MSFAYQQLDSLIHQPARLSIMAALAATKEVEFSTMRDTIEISDSLLSRYTSTLEEAGYIKVRKAFVGRRPKTWLAITVAGRKAFDSHVEMLRQIVSQDTGRNT
ncbi:transcriptional regulator [bacterium]|nr:transcriptional regulator [bacterium]NBX97703.1 transcriptional regulator [bacterium]NDC94224.1 transcriptional regulator [bacterium]NDD84920.1 transcriptional regulator [bacterium]NDG29632.1 transcriptional regulator [bacterium]